MRTRLTWAAWSMAAIFVVGCGVAVALRVATGSFSPVDVALPLAFTGFMVVGAVIVAHRPGNAVGWIFSALGLLAATGWPAIEYATAMMPVVVAVGSDPVRHRRDAWLWTCRPATAATVLVRRAVVARV